MSTYTVSFIFQPGIRNTKLLQKSLEEEVRSIINRHEFVEFYVCRDSKLDIWVASVIRQVQIATSRHNSVLILALPYAMEHEEDFRSDYDDILYVVKENVKPNVAVRVRNEFLADISNMLVACVKRPEGRAYSALRYAHVKGRLVENLADHPARS